MTDRIIRAVVRGLLYFALGVLLAHIAKQR